jgi:hypothetical protein
MFNITKIKSSTNYNSLKQHKPHISFSIYMMIYDVEYGSILYNMVLEWIMLHPPLKVSQDQGTTSAQRARRRASSSSSCAAEAACCSRVGSIVCILRGTRFFVG